MLRNVLSILNDGGPELKATDFGWFSDSDTILPAKGLKPIPEEMLVVCKCGGQCHANRCRCAKADVLCVAYCHIANSDCGNT